MYTNSQRNDYIEVLNSYLSEASHEETEYDVDAIRVRLVFVSQLTEEQFWLHKEYLLATHPALLAKGLIDVHIPNLPGAVVTRSCHCGVDIDGDFNISGELVYGIDAAMKANRHMESETRGQFDLDQRGNRHRGIHAGLSDLFAKGIKVNMTKRRFFARSAGMAELINSLTDTGLTANEFGQFPRSGLFLRVVQQNPQLLEGRTFMDSEMTFDEGRLKEMLGAGVDMDTPLGQDMGDWHNAKDISIADIVKIMEGKIQPINPKGLVDYPNILNGSEAPSEEMTALYQRARELSKKYPISHSTLCSLKHHPSIVNEQYRSKAFFHVMPAEHAEKLMKTLQSLLDLELDTEDPEYQESIKIEIKRLRYIAEGSIKSYADVDTKWVD